MLLTDAAGPFRVQTRGGARYLILFIDEYTRRPFAFLVASLSEFPQVFKDLVNMLEAELGREKVVAQLLADNHRVHISHNVELFCILGRRALSKFSPLLTL